MRLIRTAVITIWGIVACSQLEAQRAPDPYLLGPGRVGPIAAGISVDSLYRLVGRERTHLVDWHVEGFFTPALEIRLGPDTAMTMRATIGASACGYSIGGIFVFDPRYRTESGIAVGSSLRELRARHRVDLTREEGGRALAKELGMAFELSSDVFTDSVRVTAIHVLSAAGIAVCRRQGS